MSVCATLQDEFVGFMAPLAGDGLFVQPARRHPHRLGLFNASFGVWEQWKVLSVKSTGGADAHSVLVTLQPRRCESERLSQESDMNRSVLSPGAIADRGL